MSAGILGIDMASDPARTIIIMHPYMKELAPDYVAELEAMESVELIWQDTVEG